MTKKMRIYAQKEKLKKLSRFPQVLHSYANICIAWEIENKRSREEPCKSLSSLSFNQHTRPDTERPSSQHLLLKVGSPVWCGEWRRLIQNIFQFPRDYSFTHFPLHGENTQINTRSYPLHGLLARSSLVVLTPISFDYTHSATSGTLLLLHPILTTAASVCQFVVSVHKRFAHNPSAEQITRETFTDADSRP